MMREPSYDMQVVGESYYRPALERVCGPRKEEGEDYYCVAQLYCENDNAYDDNAVKVVIDREHIGYLSRDAARAFRVKFDNKDMQCAAHITAGWDRDGDVGDYCVRLDLHLQPATAAVPKERSPLDELLISCREVADPMYYVKSDGAFRIPAGVMKRFNEALEKYEDTERRNSK